MKNFLDGATPKLVAMLAEETPDGFISLMKKTKEEGAEGFCLLLQGLYPEYKTKENYERIIDSADGRMVYVANYIRDNSESDVTDEYLAAQLIEMAECGADLVDIRTDMFCRDKDEVTLDVDAVIKQKKLISDIHNLGAQVLMSTHIFEYRTPEQILEIAKLQEERGVDIAKVVTVANSQSELEDAFRTNALLNRELNIPYLFLCNGTHCKKHRLLSPFFGTSFYLCVENAKSGENQPTIEKAKRIREELKF